MSRHALRQLCSLSFSYLNPIASALPSRQPLTLFGIAQCRQWNAFSDSFVRERLRSFSTDAKKETAKGEGQNDPSAEEQTSSGEEELETELPEPEEPEQASKGSAVNLYKAILREKDSALTQLSLELEEERKKVLLGLAEAENLRARFARESLQAKKFAVQGFVQSLLGPLDNLDRAVDSLPEEFNGAEDATALDPGKTLKALKDVIVGVQMTQKDFRNVLQTHGVVRYDPLGEVFDPNEHMAQFELDDPSREPGTVGVVNLCGYKMHERVIRPADVGVIRKRHEATSAEAEETESGS